MEGCKSDKGCGDIHGWPESAALGVIHLGEIMRTRLLPVGFVLLIAATAQRASADFVTTSLLSTNNGSVNVTVNGTTALSNVVAGPYFWDADQNLPPNASFASPFSTFCIDLLGTASVGSEYVFEVIPPPSSLTTISSAANFNAIKELYGKHYDPDWASSSTYTAADKAGAFSFQLALWELVYDGSNAGNAASLGGGSFKLTAPAALSDARVQTAQSWLGGITGDTSAFTNNPYFSGKTLVALVAPAPSSDAPKKTPGQDQLAIVPDTTPVPAPPAVVLAGIGMLALGGRGRWFRKAPKA